MGARAVALAVTLAAAAVATSSCAGAASPEGRPMARPPAAGGYFTLTEVGDGFPSERPCARLVRRSRWEPRPENQRANHRVPRRLRLGSARSYDEDWNERYRPRITGAFVGTTDEIIQWAACKWGLSDEVLRAQALVESGWRQSARGDYEPRSEGLCTIHDPRDPCPTSFGLLQNKWYFNRPAYPRLRAMTSFHMDWSAAQLRGCYDGRKGLPAGSLWGCVGNWFSGGWRDGEARGYVARVRAALRAKRWRRWPDRSAGIPYLTGLGRGA
jgi:hypothetical protein